MAQALRSIARELLLSQQLALSLNSLISLISLISLLVSLVSLVPLVLFHLSLHSLLVYALQNCCAQSLDDRLLDIGAANSQSYATRCGVFGNTFDSISTRQWDKFERHFGDNGHASGAIYHAH